MADAKKTEGEETATPPKKKGKLLLFIIIGVVVVAVAAVAAVMLLKKKPVDEEDPDGENTPKKEASGGHKTEAPKAPTYVKLDPFTSNLAVDEASPAGPQYVQVVVELKVEDAHVAESIKPFTAEVRHEILRLLSGKKGAQLATMEGRDKLAEEVQLAVNMIVNPPKKSKKGKEEPPEGPVVKVLFSSFIIQ